MRVNEDFMVQQKSAPLEQVAIVSFLQSVTHLNSQIARPSRVAEGPGSNKDNRPSDDVIVKLHGEKQEQIGLRE